MISIDFNQVFFTIAHHFGPYCFLVMANNFHLRPIHASTTSKICIHTFGMSEIKSDLLSKWQCQSESNRKFTTSSHPSIFSMSISHFIWGLGQRFVRSIRYKMVLPMPFCFHFVNILHGNGSWQLSLQLKQNLWPHSHRQFRWLANSSFNWTARKQRGPGHQRNNRLC